MHHKRAEQLGEVPQSAQIVDFRVRDEHSILKRLTAIRGCLRIASSGLHGLIRAHAFSVPAAWVEFGSAGYSSLNGGRFKFKDYFQSVGIHDAKPTIVSSPSHICFNQLDYTLPDAQVVHDVAATLGAALTATFERY